MIKVGNFVLKSGKPSWFRLDCGEFVRENAEGLAWMINQVVRPGFGETQALSSSCLPLVKALQQYESGEATLLVDDVLTTGDTFEKRRQELKDSGIKMIGVTVFNRGTCPLWIHSLFELNPSLWEL